MLGLLWSFFNPLIMLGIYTFVFGIIFSSRWSGGTGNTSEFALILFAGLIVFNFFGDCFTRAPSLILSHPNYVKKVVFPLEILPWVLIGSGFFHLLVSLGVWLLVYAVFMGMPHPHLLFLPLILIPYSLFIAGASWMLASVGVYLRDVAHVTGVFKTILLFLSAIFYPLEAVPETLQNVMLLNPLILPIEMSRKVLYFGQLPPLGLWAAYSGVSFLVCYLGFVWFQKTRRGFADVV